MVRSKLGFVVLASVALLVATACEIRSGSAPSPAHPAQPQPGPAAAPSQAAPPGGGSEKNALHSSVAAEVATIRGLAHAVAVAVGEATLGLSPRARRASESAKPHVQDARRELISGRHRAARGAAQRAKTLLQPGMEELAAAPRLPPSVRQLLEQQANESRDSVSRAVVAIRSTGRLDGLEHYDQASARFEEAMTAARAGQASGAVHGLTRGMGALDHGIRTRFPDLRAE